MMFTLSKDQHAHLQAIQVGKGFRNQNEALSWALEVAAEPFREAFEAKRDKEREAKRAKWVALKKAAKQREHANPPRR